MPNHLHFILYLESPGFNLNAIISNAKRFMAYEMIKRLKQKDEEVILDKLNQSVTER